MSVFLFFVFCFGFCCTQLASRLLNFGILPMSVQPLQCCWLFAGGYYGLHNFPFAFSARWEMAPTPQVRDEAINPRSKAIQQT